ncbi:MAG: hypothetical protein IPK60_13380 [Sandaracinaceae bacterium]|nr:hypothetical protein [Sandaracinaceae bacterium]
MSRSPNRKLAGFTLVELMIAICIIITVTALAAPAIGTARADARAARASQNLIRLGRRARAESIAYGRAHLLRYTTASSVGSQGRMMLYRGVTSTCNSNNWLAILASPTCGVANSMCVDELDLGDTQYNTTTHTVLLRSPAFAFVDICYQPNGNMLHREIATARFIDQNTVAGGFAFNITRAVDGVQDGVTRTVVFPLGGVPRLFR